MNTRRATHVALAGVAALLTSAIVQAAPSQAAAPGAAPLPTAAAISPRGGALDGGDLVTLRGSGLSTATEVLFGDAVSTDITSRSDRYLTVHTPEHVAGRVAVRVVTADGMSAASRGAQFGFTVPPAPLTWSAPVAVDPASGLVIDKDVSCVSATFCMAVSDTRAAVYRNGSWSPSVALPNYGLTVRSVSCASPTLCLAVGTGSFHRAQAFVWNGRTWGTRQAASYQGSGFTDVSCAPDTTYCVLAGNSIYTVTYQAGTFTRLDLTGIAPLYASCVSRRFCMLSGYRDYASFDGATAGTVQRLRLDLTAPLSCVSSSFCLTLDRTAKYSTYDGTSWTAPKLARRGVVPVDLDCVATTYCLALDHSAPGVAIRFNGRSWSAPTGLSDRHARLFALSCWAGAQCVSIDQLGDVYRRDGGAWAGPTRVVPHTGELSDVSCGAPTTCFAADVSGNVVRFDGTRWGAPTPLLADNPVAAVSCASDTFCVAIDGYVPGRINGGNLEQLLVNAPLGGRGYVRVYNGTSWGARTRIDSVGYPTDVSCASSRFCVAVDYRGNAVTYRDGRWSAPTLIDSHRQLSAVACPTATYCVAVSRKAYATYWNGHAWSTPAKIADYDDLTDVSCADASYCAISGAYGGYYVRNGNLLGTVAFGNGSNETGNATVSCAAAYFCLLGTQNSDDDHPSLGGETYALNGAARASAEIGFRDVKADCPSTSFCAAVSLFDEQAGVGR